MGIMSNFAEVFRSLHRYSNLTLRFLGLSDAIGIGDSGNLYTVLIRSPPPTCIKCIEFALATVFRVLDMNLSTFVCWLSLRRYCRIEKFGEWFYLVLDVESLLVEVVHVQFCQVFFDVIFGCWRGRRWSLYRLWWCATNSCFVVGGNPSESPRRPFCTSPWSWMIPCQGGVLRSWFPPINLNFPFAVFGTFTNLGEIISFELGFSSRNSDASVSSTCSRFAATSTPFQISPSPTRHIRGVFRVILYSRLGGISIGQKQ